jgi:splicing factor U2AF subunit
LPLLPADIKQELANYGSVVHFVMPLPKHESSNLFSADIGQVYVEYANAGEAEKALQAIDGRKFASRTIAVVYISADQFDEKKSRWS